MKITIGRVAGDLIRRKYRYREGSVLLPHGPEDRVGGQVVEYRVGNKASARSWRNESVEYFPACCR